MAGATRIVGFQAEPFDIPLPAPFETAQARRTEARNLLVRVELAGGACGIAEIAPAPHVTGEDQAGALSLLAASAPMFVGADAAQYRRVAGAFRQVHPQAHAVAAGIEAALLDAYCRHLGAPLFRFLGGALGEVRTDVTIAILPPPEAAAAARAAVASGFCDLKVKIGSGEGDLERVMAVAAAAPGARLVLDGNQGLQPQEAVALMERVLGAGVPVALYEQPVHRDDLDGLRYVREHVPVPVAADESVVTPEEALRVVRAGAVDVVNVKLMKSGVLGAMAIAAICGAAGVRLMLGCMLESRLGIAVAAHVAAGLGVFEFVDLDGHILTADTRTSGGFTQMGNRLVLDAGEPGHGVRVSSLRTGG